MCILLVVVRGLCYGVNVEVSIISCCERIVSWCEC